MTQEERLEELKATVEETKTMILDYVTEQFDSVLTKIENSIDDIADEEMDELSEDDGDDEILEDLPEDEMSLQERINRSLLSRQIINQLQTVPATETAPIVIIGHQPAPSLAELIKEQVAVVGEAPVVEIAPALSLSEMIGSQVSEQSNLSVVYPAPPNYDSAIEPETVERAPRPLGAIIAELRNDVSAQVDVASEQVVDHMVEQAISNTPDIDVDVQGNELTFKIRQQLVSDQIKKQLS